MVQEKMPRDALHFGDVEDRDVHNAYGYLFHMGSVDCLLKQGGGNSRPFVLSRSFFAGPTESFCFNAVDPWSHWNGIFWYTIVVIYCNNHSCRLL